MVGQVLTVSTVYNQQDLLTQSVQPSATLVVTEAHVSMGHAAALQATLELLVDWISTSVNLIPV